MFAPLDCHGASVLSGDSSDSAADDSLGGYTRLPAPEAAEGEASQSGKAPIKSGVTATLERMLLCPVRECHRPLQSDGRRRVCEAGHSFDVARSGYINLLQPQDRRSRQPGDARGAVAARRRLHDKGITLPLLAGISDVAQCQEDDVALDVGSGDGFYLGSLAHQSGCEAHGVDISIPAIESAAKRYPDCKWIVANADRFIPFADASVTLLLSITARMNAPEFRRVLCPDGRLLVAVPGPDDLVELRGSGRDRLERTVQEFGAFQLVRHERITTTAELDADAVKDVLLSIYRPASRQPVEGKRVTLSLDVLLFS